MYPEWQAYPILQREDGSYVITKDGHPYHVPNEGPYTAEYTAIAAYAAEHPDQVEKEAPYTPPTEEETARANAKTARADKMAKLTVKVDGLPFDANEKSQNLISRLLFAAQQEKADFSAQNIPWVLADNSVTTVSYDQLARVLSAALAAQRKVWMKPYNLERSQ